MPKITPWQIVFPEEARLVGALLSGYGELEFELWLCVSSGMNDIDTTFRAMFRMRNESQRIDLADALLAPALAKYDLADAYSHAIGAIRHCKAIRNNFAHCHWVYQGDPPQLTYCNLEDAAKSSQGEPTITFMPVSEALLSQQVSYFGYCSDWLAHIHHEFDLRSGRITEHGWPAPKVLPQPRLHNLDKKNQRR